MKEVGTVHREKKQKKKTRKKKKQLNIQWGTEVKDDRRKTKAGFACWCTSGRVQSGLSEKRALGGGI